MVWLWFFFLLLQVYLFYGILVDHKSHFLSRRGYVGGLSCFTSEAATYLFEEEEEIPAYRPQTLKAFYFEKGMALRQAWSKTAAWPNIYQFKSHNYPRVDEFYAVTKRQSTEFEALNLPNVRSGGGSQLEGCLRSPLFHSDQAFGNFIASYSNSTLFKRDDRRILSIVEKYFIGSWCA